jgi:hypothetical protein
MQSAISAERTRYPAGEPSPVIPQGGLRLLLALFPSNQVEADTLRSRLNVGDAEYRSILNALQRQYLVDVVSGLEGEEVHETLRLTEHGEDVLTRLMERTYELPE